MPRVMKAASQGCDWLLKTMREDGGWPYAFDLEGQAITQACGAGQIWNTWALWRMYEVTGEDKYRQAALKSKEFFQKTYMDVHRYVGYWEDTVGITKEDNQTIRSWEAYEPAIATLVFQEMGDADLAVAAARDAATWTWTRVTSTRQYETSYGQTTEQATCGPSQAQSPLIGVAFHAMYETTGEQLWSDLSGAVKAVNFCADPDQEYGMVATSGWCIPQYAVAGPPYENTRPFVSPNMRQGDYGRQLWTGWCTDQFAWLALEWLVREANLRAPQYVQIDPENLRGTVLGEGGRVKMPEEKCDLVGLEHHDFNWVGYQNDRRYMLLVMNHKEAVNVLVRPHEAHLGVYHQYPTDTRRVWRNISSDRGNSRRNQLASGDSPRWNSPVDLGSDPVMHREGIMAGHVCPWWGGYFIDNWLRRLFHDPDAILRPYVHPGMTVMDVGCGMGLFAIAMARLVGPTGKVIAVDLQQQMLDVLGKRALKAGVADRIFNAPLRGHFDRSSRANRFHPVLLFSPRSSRSRATLARDPPVPTAAGQAACGRAPGARAGQAIRVDVVAGRRDRFRDPRTTSRPAESGRGVGEGPGCSGVAV